MQRISLAGSLIGVCVLIGAAHGWSSSWQPGAAAATPAVTPSTGVLHQPEQKPAAATFSAPVTPSDLPLVSSHHAAADAYFTEIRRPAPGLPPVPRAVTAEAALAAGIRTAASAAGSPGNGPAGPAWAQIGTAPSGGQIAGGGNVSGRVSAITPDPTDSTGNTVYIAAAMGGVWKTTNAEAAVDNVTWTPLTDGQASLAVTAVVLDPSNHLNVFAATGDWNAGTIGGSTSRSGYFGAGILFSSNGGTSWTTIGASTFSGDAILDMAMPNSTTLYVAASNGFWIGTLSGGTWTFSRKGTGTWTSVRVDQFNSDYVELGAKGGPAVYRPSANSLTLSLFCSNGGSSTTNCSATTGGISAANVGRTSVAVDPVSHNQSHVVASMQCSTSSGVCPTTTRGCTGTPSPASCPVDWWGLWESTDFGATYHPLLIPMDVNSEEFSQTFYDLSIAMDPLDDNIIYFGLIHLWTYSYQGAVIAQITCPGLLPDACGEPFGTARFGMRPGIHSDQHALAFDSAGTLYAGTDGGVFRSPAGSEGASWADLNTNLEITQFKAGLGFNYDSTGTLRTLLGGTQDNGTEFWNGTGWQVIVAGDGSYTVMDPTNPDICYAEIPSRTILKSTNCTTPWSAGGPTFHSAATGMNSNDGGRSVVGANANAPFTMDPYNQYLLAGADRPYLSRDGAKTWTAINGSIFPLESDNAISATTICPNASDPLHVATFYVGTNHGEIYRSTDGLAVSPTWTKVSAGLPHQLVTRVVCLSDGTAYATYGGSQTGEGHVFRLATGATSWTSIQGTLLDTTVSTVVADTRQTPALLYAATDFGAYSSADSGVTWSLFGAGLPNVPVTDLLLDTAHDVLYASTWGRGVWQVASGGGATVPVVVTPATAANSPVWVNSLTYGSVGGGFYWDFTSGTVWTAERGWHSYSPQNGDRSATLWVNFLSYGSVGGGFYLDPLSGQVWTAERGWHQFSPAPR